MRADDRLNRQSFRGSPYWKKDARTGAPVPDVDRLQAGGYMKDDQFIAHSLSGHERNHYFANQAGQYRDRSALSGLDHPGDARGFAILDYDRDGRQDIAVVNANAPLLNLYRNEGSNEGNFIGVRLLDDGKEGGRGVHGGTGSMVSATLSDGTVLKRELRCGDGFAAQNSMTLLIGIGSDKEVDSVSVQRPGATTNQVARSVSAGTLLTFSAGNEAERREAYVAKVDAAPVSETVRPVFPLHDLVPTNEEYVMYTTMATWCAACKSHLSELEELAARAQEDGVQLVGIPIDPTDDADTLREYEVAHGPPYRLLGNLPTVRRRQVTKFLQHVMQRDELPLPTTILTDGDGRLLLVGQGVPSLSVLRKALGE